MRKFINILILTIALIGSVSAQSLDDLSKKVFDMSFGIINKGMNAYEEHLEKQELEAAKKAEKEALEAKKAEEEAKKAEEERKAEEDCELLKASAIDYSIEHKVWIKCYYYPFDDYNERVEKTYESLVHRMNRLKSFLLTILE